MTAPVAVIAGECFRTPAPDEMPQARVAYVLKVLQACGIEGLRLSDSHSPWSIENAALLVMARVVASGKMPALLAGFLSPDGEEWSVESAHQVAAFLSQLSLAEGQGPLLGRGQALALLATTALGLIVGDWPTLRERIAAA
ncbi:MAG: hypothetical protein ACREOQ_06270 [Gemmatimonadales bacterium]